MTGFTLEIPILRGLSSLFRWKESVSHEPCNALLFTESETSALNASEVVEAYGDSRLSESDGRRSAGEMIFDGDNPEERGDQVVGPDFECGGVEVIWLANNELDASSVEKDRYIGLGCFG